MDNSLSYHHHKESVPDLSLPDPHQNLYSMTMLGFWIYLLTDCLLFGSLFATYAVLHHETFGGPSSKDLFSLKLAFSETMILLTSSMTCGFALLSAVKNKQTSVIGWLIVTFLLGASFLTLEISEFKEFVDQGHSWKVSAFLSAFFTLVGTHGAHITVGLVWLCVMVGQIYHFGITTFTFRRLAVFGLFWHFLDLIWIFIFTFVYLMGVV